MDAESVDSVEGSVDFFDSDEITSTLDKPLWFGREVQLSTEKNLRLELLAQFFFLNLKRMDDILNLESGAHRYHLLDLQEEITEEISLNFDHYADFAYFSALHHPSNRGFTLIDPKNYPADIVRCKSALKSVYKGLKKTEKLIGKGVKKGAKKVAHFVKEHKKEILIGAAIVAVAVGAFYIAGSMANAAATATAAGLGAAQGTGKRREDEKDPESNDPIDLAPPPPNKDPVPLSSFLSEQEKAHIEKSNPLGGLSAASPPTPSSPNKMTQFQNGVEFLGKNSGSSQSINGMIAGSSTPFNMPEYHNEVPLQTVISGFLETIGKGLSKLILNPIEDFKGGVRNTKLLIGSPRSCHIETEGIKHLNKRIGFINGMNTTLEEARCHLEHIRQFAGGMSVEGVYNHSNTAIGDGLEILFLNYGGIAPVTSDLLMENWTRFHEENINDPDAKYLQFAHSMGTILTKAALSKAPQEIRDRIIVVSIGPAVIIPDKLCYESIPYASNKDLVHLGENIFAAIVSGAMSNDSQQSLQRYAKLVEDKQHLTLLEQHPQSEGMGHGFEDPIFNVPIESQIRNYLNSNGQYR